MINPFIDSALLTSSFFIVYFLIRNVNIKLTKFYILFVQIILIYEIWIRIFSQEIDIMYIVVLLFYQFLLVLFMNDTYKKDRKVEALYNIISNSNFNPIFLSGLQEIEIEKLGNYSDELKRFLTLIFPSPSRNYGYIIVENGELQISMILFRKNVYYEEIKDQVSYCEYLEIENIKKGCQIKYVIK